MVLGVVTESELHFSNESVLEDEVHLDGLLFFQILSHSHDLDAWSLLEMLVSLVELINRSDNGASNKIMNLFKGFAVVFGFGFPHVHCHSSEDL